MKMPSLIGLLLLVAGWSGSGMGAAPGDRSLLSAEARPTAPARPTPGGGASHGGSGSAGSRPAGAGGLRPGGGGEHGVFPPSGGHLPTAGSRPEGRPAAMPQGGLRPTARPEEPGSRPGSAGQLPSLVAPQPSTRPAPRPGMPTPPSAHPTTKPAPRPQPGEGDFLGLRPDRPMTKPVVPGAVRPEGPMTKPAVPGAVRPEGPMTKPALPGVVRPEGPMTKPAVPGAVRPEGPMTKPVVPGAVRPEGPTTKPAVPGAVRPDRPLTKPAVPGAVRPGGGGWNRPVGPLRPDWGDRWNLEDQRFGSQYLSWQQANALALHRFQSARMYQWERIERLSRERGWYGRYGSKDYGDWRREVMAYRGWRCQEIWGRSYGYHDAFFHAGWWGACWWRPVPMAVRPVRSPWWWWRPLGWVSVERFFGPAVGGAVLWDPGTTIIYEGDAVYINGERAGDAAASRRQAMALAAPALEAFPVPEPSAVEGRAEEWLPLGVWALTQQEEGDAVMFLQLSVDRNGIVAGAYKNIMTGEEQPVIGRLDKASQRLAWHLDNNLYTVYETWLSGLTYDVASVFVHFGEEQTQTWLLVRLPSPEMPVGSVKLPEIIHAAPRK